MFNKIALIAEENNIPFINYSSQKMLDEINFDFKNDMYNIGHMNIVGANKVSTHFANFLNENYNLPNHKSDPYYANWQIEADGFFQREKTMDIIYIYDLQSYTDYILNEDSFIGLYFDTKSNTPSVTIYDKDVNTYSIDTTNSTSITLSDGTNILINTYIEDDIIFKININDSSINIKNNSHTITVYDKVLNEFVDSVPVEDTKLIR